MFRNTLVSLLLGSVSLTQAVAAETSTKDYSFDASVNSIVVAGIDAKDQKNGQNPIVRVRAFFAMEDSGIRNVYPELADSQAIGDYAVNCSQQSLAITEFRVLSSSEMLPAGMSSSIDSKLSFSSPKFDSELKVVRAACGSSVASISNNMQ